MSHTHLPCDVQPGTVTLCVSDGLRFVHMPVDLLLWDNTELTEEQREQVRDLARRRLNSPSVAVDVVRAEDTGIADR
ncbi:hypothetical protein ACFWH1_18440 [Streptomyces sp. NPDC127037]|uniref:hypothetical protein n=1 Tax=Streptomyces sp. NPDC127037 TaxID=3347113 RepID=UPI003658BA04